MQLTFWSRVREARLIRVVVVYLASSWLLLQVTSLFIQSFDLPKWFMPAAVLLLLIGLVIITATTWVQSYPSTAARAAAEEIPGAWEIDLGDMKDSVASGRLPHLTWARAILGGIVAFSLLFGLAGIYVIVEDRERSFGPSKVVAGNAAPGIAVLPFSVSGEGLEPWREGMVDLVSTDLSGVEGLRAIDSRTVLARWRESVTGSATPDLRTALEVARRTGARYALLGSAVSSGSGIRLSADVYEIAGHKMIGTGQVEGTADGIFGLVDRLSIETLRVILRGEERDLPRVNLARTTTTSLPALKAYLEGEVLFRHSDFQGAIEAYQLAVEADSTFALALAHLGDAYSWATSFFGDSTVITISRYIAQAARFADRLPPHQAVLVRGWRALDRGTLDGIDLLEGEVRRYPDDADAWYLLGTHYAYLGGQALIDPRQADRAFAKAIELDSSFTPVYIELIRHAFARDDSAATARLLATYVRLAPKSPHVPPLRVAFGLAFSDSASRAWARAELDTMQTLSLLRTANPLSSSPRLVPLAEEVLRMARQRDDAPITVPILLFGRSVDQGKIRAALQCLDDPLMPEQFEGQGLYLLHAIGVTVPRDRLEATLTLSQADNSDVFQLFYGGAYAADLQRWGDHAAALSRLRAAAARLRATADTTGAVFAEGAAQGLEGYGWWRRGEKERARDLLEQARRRATGWGDRWGVNAHLHWRLGQLLVEMGRPREALRYFESFGRQPPATYESAQLHEQLGEFAQAREAYTLFVTAWQDADLELQPKVQEARAAIQRLSSVVKK